MTDTVSVSDSAMAVRVELLLRRSKTTLKPPRTLKKVEWPPNYDEILVWRAAQLSRYEADPVFLDNAKAFYANNCAAFINHWCDTYDPRNAGTDKSVWMPMILFDKQNELVEFVLKCLQEEQPGLVEKARGIGATWICVAISVWAWLFIPGIAIGWGSKDKSAVGVVGDPSSIFEKIRQLIRRIPSQFLPSAINDTEDVNDKKNLKALQIINPDTGATIVGQIGDNIGRGGRTRVYFKDESAYYEHPEMIEASLSATTRVPIDISSVNGLGNMFHRKREAGLDWYPGAELPKGKTRVFVMDLKDTPFYSDEWIKQTRAYYDDIGAPHIFASEFERNYAASVQGTIISKDQLDHCIDAHIKLGLPETANKVAGLDIGDSEDGDRNAASIRTGVVLTYANEWVARDPGVTARKAMGLCVDNKVPELQYDAAGGLGSIVKSEANRLMDEGAYPKDLFLVPWNAGGKVLQPADRVVPQDSQSLRNKDFFTNLKAQAWWHLRKVVYNTYVAVTRGGKYDSTTNLVMVPGGIDTDGKPIAPSAYDIDDLFSIDSRLPLLHKVTKELCQATIIKGSKLKLLVDKAPDGTKSPNIADSIVMAYWPMPRVTGAFTDIGLGAKVFIGGVKL